MDKPIIQIRNLEELKKVLFLQKTISQRAKNEMLAIASDGVLPEGCTNEELQKHAAAFMAEEQKLLAKYAKYPTLTEFAMQPHLADASKWGATFGVAIISGELIFEQVRNMQPHFGPVLRQMFILLLNELDHPNTENKFLIDPLVRALKFNVTSEDGSEVSEEKRLQYVQMLVGKLVEDFIIVGTEYGLIESKGEGFGITELGRRVMFHLMDATKFIDEMTKAHERFQSAKPKLSMI